MAINIRKRYQQESVLYAFIRKYVIDWNVVQDFRDVSINMIKNWKDVEYEARYKTYLENPNIFLQPEWIDKVDALEFKEVVDHIESFYRETIHDFTNFRYYQYISLLITYIFCKLCNNVDFKKNYLDFIAHEVLEHWSDWNYSVHVDSSFNRLWYWMATASWKTLLMYAIVYMYIKLIGHDIKTLYVLVPSDELRTQHLEFLNKFGHFWWSRDAVISINNLSFFNDRLINVKLTTLSKMLWDDDWRWLDSNSLMIFDEAHKWAASTKEDSATETLKNNFIAKKWTFLFEFSATFQKAFESDNKRLKQLSYEDRNIFDWYLFSSIMKYNLYDFNVDGFWKSYYVNNMLWSDDSNIEWKRKLVCDSLVHLWLQLLWYEAIKEEYQTTFEDCWTYLLHRDWTKLYKPLYMGLSWKLVDDKWNVDGQSWTSLIDILKNISYIFSHYDEFIPYIRDKIRILYDDELKISELQDPKDLFKLLTWEDYTQWKQVSLKLWYDKQVDEIKLLLWNKKMLINTWSNSKVAEILKDEITNLFSLQDQFWAWWKWFDNIDNDKDILYVFWSKKFIEWWDSKRPSTIMLFKMWKWSTVIATQILWRWLRLAWKNWDWFRHIWLRLKFNPARNHHSHLTEFVWLFWYEIDEFKNFIDQISGDILYLRIHKERKFTPSFEKYLIDKWIDVTNTSEVNKFLWKTFTYYYQEINKTANPIEWTTLIVDDSEAWIVKLKMVWAWWEKSVWTINSDWNEKKYSTDVWLLAWWTWTVGALSETNWYKLYWNEIIWEWWIDLLLEKMHNLYNPNWQLEDSAWNSIKDVLWMFALETNYITKEQVEWKTHKFDIGLQKRIVKIFTDYIEDLFESIDRHIGNLKEKEIDTKVWALNLDNFIEWLTVNLWIKKTEDWYKAIKELFDLEDSVFMLDENYENLSDAQKEIFDPYLKTKANDLHFYERLYYIPVATHSDDWWHLHDINKKIDVKWWLVPLYDFSPDPIDLKLNFNEESRIEKILEDIERDVDFFKNFDIFYLRNLVGVSNWWIRFAYEEDAWNLKYFFPDFLFWFINKESWEKTLVYFEPKSSIDPNRMKKDELLDKEIWRDIDEHIVNLFDKASAWNETFWGWMKL